MKQKFDFYYVRKDEKNNCKSSLHRRAGCSPASMMNLASGWVGGWGGVTQLKGQVVSQPGMENGAISNNGFTVIGISFDPADDLSGLTLNLPASVSMTTHQCLAARQRQALLAIDWKIFIIRFFTDFNTLEADAPTHSLLRQSAGR